MGPNIKMAKLSEEKKRKRKTAKLPPSVVTSDTTKATTTTEHGKKTTSGYSQQIFLADVLHLDGGESEAWTVAQGLVFSFFIIISFFLIISSFWCDQAESL